MTAEITPNTPPDTTIKDSAAVATSALAATPDVASAAAKPVEGEKKGEDAAPKTALEAAKRVMAKEAKPASEAKPQDGTQAPAEVADADKAKPTDTEFDDPALPFKDHPAYKKWASEHRILKVAKEKNEKAIADMEPRVKAHDDLLGYFTSNNLNQQDVASGLSIMSAVRNDPARAYELLTPIYENLKAMVGVTLPQDIQARVESGALDAESAQELARSRAAAGLERQRATSMAERGERERQDRTRADQEAQTGTIAEALNTWGREWTARDPDAAKKQPLLEPMLERAWETNPPRTPEEARAQADAVLAKFNEAARLFVPSTQAKSGHLPVGGASITAAPVPSSSLEAAKAALRAGV